MEVFIVYEISLSLHKYMCMILAVFVLKKKIIIFFNKMIGNNYT